MVYSYSQINQYLSCPRGYRYRYLEGWKEKDTRANLVFGRAFEQALSAYFRGEECDSTCTMSGLSSEARNSITDAATPGTARSRGAFSCWSASAKKIACAAETGS
jgi:hypothetical protein